ncbi:MAG: SH3 domain-containing protein [Proteobacteria bacterium]|nr:SH3 domain-containing protein [Pseudomonadota bacterium]MBU2228127.1 SH3 domain-containing protein [Pseudomonadota bacterium]MBU2260344.1 SH3 domain-containing protein [Pseudomonadota bacterium]
MKRLRLFLLVALFLCAFGLPLFSATQAFLSVQVKEGQLRSAPSFLGSVMAALAYGDRVELIEDKGAWKQVAIRKLRGWMHMSALTTKKIVLQAGAADVQTSATGSELALAGKGFNAKVEAEFRTKNKDIDYTWVDRMEALAVKPEQMQAFLRQGQVNPPKEDAP